MIKVDYIKVKQRDIEFFFTKIKASELKTIVDFHFREPYREYSTYENKSFSKLLLELDEIGIKRSDRTENSNINVQRYLDRSRVLDIKDYINSDENAFFPNSVLLAIDTSETTKIDETPELGDSGKFTIEDKMNVSIIDGQHRLAGLFLADANILEDFEIPVIFMLDVSIATASLLFQKINGKQKQVNRSVIYDLFENVSTEDISKNDLLTKQYHQICVSLNSDINSPMFNQIKMLGVGGGAISQAFFIETCKKHLKSFERLSVQDRFNRLYDYFILLQHEFMEDWPVPIKKENESIKEFILRIEEHSNEVLKNKKSQLLKTNGFAAIIRLLEYCTKNELNIKNCINKIKISELEFDNLQGTGVQAQNNLFNKLVEIVSH